MNSTQLTAGSKFQVRRGGTEGCQKFEQNVLFLSSQFRPDHIDIYAFYVINFCGLGYMFAEGEQCQFSPKTKSCHSGRWQRLYHLINSDRIDFLFYHTYVNVKCYSTQIIYQNSTSNINPQNSEAESQEMLLSLACPCPAIFETSLFQNNFVGDFSCQPK